MHLQNLHKCLLYLVTRCYGGAYASECIPSFCNDGKSRTISNRKNHTYFAISEGWVWTITLVGLITLFWASLNATKQHDLKGILAFSTVSQLGMIMSMLGIGAVSYHYQGANSQLYVAGFVAAIFHLINHATFKGALFMITGGIDHSTGTRDVKKLGGLLTIMPISFTLTVITTLSMAGVPPFNGFYQREILRVND